jgi:hypothetical protein
LGTCHFHGSRILTAGTPVPDEGVVTHPMSTDAIQISTTPVVTLPVTVSTLPRRIDIPQHTVLVRKMLLLFLLL